MTCHFFTFLIFIYYKSIPDWISYYRYLINVLNFVLQREIDAGATLLYLYCQIWTNSDFFDNPELFGNFLHYLSSTDIKLESHRPKKRPPHTSPGQQQPPSKQSFISSFFQSIAQKSPTTAELEKSTPDETENASLGEVEKSTNSELTKSTSILPGNSTTDALVQPIMSTLEQMNIDTPNDAPVTNASIAAIVQQSIQQSITPYMRLVETQGRQLDHTTSRVTAVEKRLEFLEREARANSICVWNFPMKSFPIDFKMSLSAKADAVRKFLVDLMKIPQSNAACMLFQDIAVIPNKKKADYPMVRIKYADRSDKEFCRSYARNLHEYNTTCDESVKIRFKSDLTVAQRDEFKKRPLEGTANGNGPKNRRNNNGR